MQCVRVTTILNAATLIGIKYRTSSSFVASVGGRDFIKPHFVTLIYFVILSFPKVFLRTFLFSFFTVSFLYVFAIRLHYLFQRSITVYSRNI